MFGAIVTAAVGTLSFKLGMDAAKMRAEGKDLYQIAAELPHAAYKSISDSISFAIGYFTSDDDSDSTQKAPEKKSSSHKKSSKKPAKKSSSKKASVGVPTECLKS